MYMLCFIRLASVLDRRQAGTLSWSHDGYLLRDNYLAFLLDADSHASGYSTWLRLPQLQPRKKSGRQERKVGNPLLLALLSASLTVRQVAPESRHVIGSA